MGLWPEMLRLERIEDDGIFNILPLPTYRVRFGTQWYRWRYGRICWWREILKNLYFLYLELKPIIVLTILMLLCVRCAYPSTQVDDSLAVMKGFAIQKMENMAGFFGIGLSPLFPAAGRAAGDPPLRFYIFPMDAAPTAPNRWVLMKPRKNWIW